MRWHVMGGVRHRREAGLGLILFVSLALWFGPIEVHAQSCGLGNWSQLSDLDNSFTGVQGPANRRYGGPCGLRVPLDGVPRFVTDHRPDRESRYILRFYAFLGSADTADPVRIYAAGDGVDDLIEIWLNEPSAGELTLRVLDAEQSLHDLTFPNAPARWNSIEFVWEAAVSAEIRFALNSDDPTEDLVATINTSGQRLFNASLGNLNGASGGAIDFDAYDSRRASRPGRLLTGDADDDWAINVADIIAIADEIDSLGFAPGQPDCDEDGEIEAADVACIVAILDNQ